MIKWFRKWRAWVRYESSRRDAELLEKVKREMTSVPEFLNQNALNIIDIVHRADKRSKTWRW